MSQCKHTESTAMVCISCTSLCCDKCTDHQHHSILPVDQAFEHLGLIDEYAIGAAKSLLSHLNELEAAVQNIKATLTKLIKEPSFVSKEEISKIHQQSKLEDLTKILKSLTLTTNLATNENVYKLISQSITTLQDKYFQCKPISKMFTDTTSKEQFHLVKEKANKLYQNILDCSAIEYHESSSEQERCIENVKSVCKLYKQIEPFAMKEVDEDYSLIQFRKAMCMVRINKYIPYTQKIAANAINMLKSICIDHKCIPEWTLEAGIAYYRSLNHYAALEYLKSAEDYYSKNASINMPNLILSAYYKLKAQISLLNENKFDVTITEAIKKLNGYITESRQVVILCCHPFMFQLSVDLCNKHFYKEALDVFTNYINPKKECSLEMQLHKCFLLMKIKNPNQIVEAKDKLLTMFKTNSSNACICKANMFLGKFHQINGETQLSVEYYNKAFNSVSNNNTIESSHLYYSIAKLYNKNKIDDMALQAINRAVDILLAYKHHNQQTLNLLAKTYALYIHAIALCNGNLNKAMIIFEQTKHLFENNEQLLIKLYHSTAKCHLEIGEPATALTLMSKAAEISGNVNTTFVPITLKLLCELGNYQPTSKLVEIACYYALKESAKHSQTSKYHCQLLLRIAYFYINQGSYQEAIICLTQLINIKQESMKLEAFICLSYIQDRLGEENTFYEQATKLANIKAEEKKNGSDIQNVLYKVIRQIYKNEANAQCILKYVKLYINAEKQNLIKQFRIKLLLAKLLNTIEKYQEALTISDEEIPKLQSLRFNTTKYCTHNITKYYLLELSFLFQKGVSQYHIGNDYESKLSSMVEANKLLADTKYGNAYKQAKTFFRLIVYLNKISDKCYYNSSLKLTQALNETDTTHEELIYRCLERAHRIVNSLGNCRHGLKIQLKEQLALAKIDMQNEDVANSKKHLEQLLLLAQNSYSEKSLNPAQRAKYLCKLGWCCKAIDINNEQAIKHYLESYTIYLQKFIPNDLTHIDNACLIYYVEALYNYCDLNISNHDISLFQKLDEIPQWLEICANKTTRKGKRLSDRALIAKSVVYRILYTWTGKLNADITSSPLNGINDIFSRYLTKGGNLSGLLNVELLLSERATSYNDDATKFNILSYCMHALGIFNEYHRKWKESQISLGMLLTKHYSKDVCNEYIANIRLNFHPPLQDWIITAQYKKSIAELTEAVDRLIADPNNIENYASRVHKGWYALMTVCSNSFLFNSQLWANQDLLNQSVYNESTYTTPTKYITYNQLKINFIKIVDSSGRYVILELPSQATLLDVFIKNQAIVPKYVEGAKTPEELLLGTCSNLNWNEPVWRINSFSSNAIGLRIGGFFHMYWDGVSFGKDSLNNLCSIEYAGIGVPEQKYMPSQISYGIKNKGDKSDMVGSACMIYGK